MTSRETILKNLRDARQPFGEMPIPDEYLPMTPITERDVASLRKRFITEAEKLSCTIHSVDSESAAVEEIMALLGEDESVISWDAEQLPIPMLAETLTSNNIKLASPTDPSVRVGISGADSALAATGSLIITSGAGRYRTASLLPPVHIAIVRESHIVANLESWISQQRAAGLDLFREMANVVVVSGPSRTADIAMQLILGMHGPRELHIVLVAE